MTDESKAKVMLRRPGPSSSELLMNQYYSPEFFHCPKSQRQPRLPPVITTNTVAHQRLYHTPPTRQHPDDIQRNSSRLGVEWLMSRLLTVSEDSMGDFTNMKADQEKYEKRKAWPTCKQIDSDFKKS